MLKPCQMSQQGYLREAAQSAIDTKGLVASEHAGQAWQHCKRQPCPDCSQQSAAAGLADIATSPL